MPLTTYHSSPYLIGTDVIAHRYINEEDNMGGFKETHTYELNEDHAEWLKEMAEKYTLDDESKALRIVLDYVMQEADHDEVFEEMRCHHCG